MGGNANPKVLVVSHNVFSSLSNMGKTLSVFFDDWDSDSIAQLYFHSEVPDSNICNHYFRVTDWDVLFSVIKSNSGTIEQIEDPNMDKLTTNREDTGIRNAVYRLGRGGRPIMRVLRNLAWRFGTWYTDELSEWIDQFNPDVVFFASGNYSFSINVALRICQEKQLPLITYFGDEYYFLNNYRFSFLNRIDTNNFRKSFREMFTYLSTFVTASDKMLKVYEKEFDKKGYAIMTSTKIRGTAKMSEGDVAKVSYIGNLGLNRWKPLVEIGLALKRMGLFLDIYSGETRKKVLAQLNNSNGIRFHGAIPANKVGEIMDSSTLLVHVESMDKTMRERTRYSMSTKIAESLGSGVCLFAYGPSDVSSIEYLVENEAACVVTRKEDLEVRLGEILSNSTLRQKYVQNALKLARVRHDYATNSLLFSEMIVETCNDWGKAK